MLDAARKELFKHIDHSAHKTFNEMSRGLSYIGMSDLIYFLENNGFYPRIEDLEAILRRCDHDADRALSFNEFCEVVELPGESSKESVEKIEVEDKGLKASASNARLDSTPAEDLDEAWDRKEAERREQEWRNQQAMKHEAASKVVGFISDKVAEFVNINYQKKLLSYHGSFNIMEFFKELDVN